MKLKPKETAEVTPTEGKRNTPSKGETEISVRFRTYDGISHKMTFERNPYPGVSQCPCASHLLIVARL